MCSNFNNRVNLVFTWNVTVSVHGVVAHFLNAQVKTQSNGKFTASRTVLYCQCVVSAPQDVVEALSRVPQLLKNMVLAYGHSEGFLQALTLFQPPERYI